MRRDLVSEARTSFSSELFMVEEGVQLGVRGGGWGEGGPAGPSVESRAL